MFKFSLQAVKDKREADVERVTSELNGLQASIDEQKQKLGHIQHSYLNCKQELMDELVNGQYRKERLYHYHLEGLKEQLMNALTLIHQLKRKVEVKKMQLLKAKQNEKIICELAEKEKDKYIRDREQKEQRTFDEMTILRLAASRALQ